MIYTPTEKLMALSWKQPYAELMLHGKIETRTWNTYYRGWVLICASQKGYNFNKVWSIAGGDQMERITKILGRNNDHFLNNYRSGIAIGVGRLVDCRPMKFARSEEDKCFVEYRDGLFCHIYEDVCAIEPIPFKGRQRWKEVDEDIKQQIKFIHNPTPAEEIKSGNG